MSNKSKTASVQTGGSSTSKILKQPKSSNFMHCTIQGEKVKTGFASYEIVPIGHIWLQGDNVTNSTDSRNYGAVPLGLVRSRAVCKVWPPRRISMLNNS